MKFNPENNSAKSKLLDLTIILPLKDHPERTREWLKCNYYEELNYYIADGSIQPENNEIFNNFLKDNIKYRKYNPDYTINDFVIKICESIGEIKTNYIMFSDNDDYLLIDGIRSLYQKIKNDSSIDGVQGRIPWVNEDENGFLRKTTREWYQMPNIQSGIEGLEYLVSNYNQLWYAIYKKNVQKEIFDLYRQLKCNNIYLIEEFQSYIALSTRRIVYISTYYYVRTKNSKSSSSNYFTNLENSFRYHFILNKEYLNDFVNLTKFISIKLNFDFNYIFNLLRKRKIIESGFIKSRYRSEFIIKLNSFLMDIFDNHFRFKFHKSDIQKKFK